MSLEDDLARSLQNQSDRVKQLRERRELRDQLVVRGLELLLKAADAAVTAIPSDLELGDVKIEELWEKAKSYL